LAQGFATEGGPLLHNGDVLIAAITSCTNTSNPGVMLAAGLLGYVGARVTPQFFSSAPAHTAATRRYGAALIDDDTAPPVHARFSRGRLAAVLGAGAALWLAPMALLLASQGAAGTFTQMAWFFTKAALLTFGGAYAVLPYVYQGAVVHYGWLTPTQMIDGLALGETTPGPLIMVVAFVAFVGAWQSAELVALFGPDRLFLAAALAATLVTWFTFLPSFVFILAGGPLVEATHDKLAFTGPLTAITAAVVGVVLNLALFFAWHVLWPQGWSGGFDQLNFALIKIAKTNNNRFSLVAEKIDVDLKLHPQKINDKLPHPSYQHWIFREIKEGKIYQTIDKPQGLLEKLHTDYPKISIPGINKLKIIVFNTKAKPPLERIIIEIKVHREGGFYLEMYENTYKRPEGLPAKKPKVVKNQEAEPNLVEEDKKGYYTSLIELKRNKKK
jgi:chromate transport protein ChrA